MTASRRFPKFRRTIVVLSMVLVASLAAIPTVWTFGLRDGDSLDSALGGLGEEAVPIDHTSRVVDSASLATDGPTSAAESPESPESPASPPSPESPASPPSPEQTGEHPTNEPVPVGDPTPVDLAFNSSATQGSFYRMSDGLRRGTASERFAFPALSLAKLYIADYVLAHGTEAQAEAALEMVRSSDNAPADHLYSAYPQSINAVADEYQLYSTIGAEHWGYSSTSMYDVVHFVASLMAQDPEHPILVAMAEADEIAADGYPQDFGTAVLPGARGSKWGWSDDRTVHSSVTFGDGWVAAAATAGSAADLTAFAEAQMTDAVSAAKGEDRVGSEEARAEPN